ncbi:sulfite exporter TauE/SafE family protein [Aliidiomarina taiwanensis]|uniref:Probable membrane transporter protein n=1 Tax=Aliidiomarina taiwanensis TaxID=946228 RepID=A0A432X9N5_9GAMM|nr:sulfite exporter TauE/SafE family protein [Aliidiomarina taiwanensis]RUO44133.1 sulfite exporter TauE/SafE family protein [Aliidiomarina taiwanensis]
MDATSLALIAGVVLLTGISKSAFAGALGVFAVPLLMLSFPAPQAIALMLPILIMGDALSVRSYWQKWDTQLLMPLLPGAVVGVLVAYLIIDAVNPSLLRTLIAIICIAFALKSLLFKHIQLTFFKNKLGAFGMSTTSGITSSLVHAGGPPILIYFSAIGLAPSKFVATAAVFFALMNLLKLAGAVSFDLLSLNTLGTALLFFPLSLLGNWLGVTINERLNKERFLTVMNALLLVLGFWMLFT